jgi:hypothetical protein
MTVKLHWEQCCESPDCMRPAHHGVLCAVCFLAATPARRAVELLAGAPAPNAIAAWGQRHVSHEGAAWLEELWAA